MSCIVTYTVEPDAETVIWGVLNHAYLIAALMLLCGLLCAPILTDKEDRHE